MTIELMTLEGFFSHLNQIISSHVLILRAARVHDEFIAFFIIFQFKQLSHMEHTNHPMHVSQHKSFYLQFYTSYNHNTSLLGSNMHIRRYIYR